MRVRFGKFTLDSGRRELLRGDEAVQLPPKVLQLLELLIAQRPKAVSQQELYDALWPDTLVEKTVLHNLIYQLRSALDDGAHEVIRTAHGFGFAFEATAIEVEPKPFTGGWQLVIGDDEYDLVEGENLVGREMDVAIRINSPSVSRHHARVVVSRDGVAIEDLGSKNGTYVAGRRIRRVDHVENGMDILFGSIAATLRDVRPSGPTETVR